VKLIKPKYKNFIQGKLLDLAGSKTQSALTTKILRRLKKLKKATHSTYIHNTERSQTSFLTYRKPKSLTLNSRDRSLSKSRLQVGNCKSKQIYNLKQRLIPNPLIRKRNSGPSRTHKLRQHQEEPLVMRLYSSALSWTTKRE
jgi:hypothetical protein